MYRSGHRHSAKLMDDGEIEDSANSFVASVSFLPVYHRMQPPGFQGGAEIKKVAWRLFFFYSRGWGCQNSREGTTGLATFQKTQNPNIDIYLGTL